MRILVGMQNIASLYSEFRKGFELLGHEVVTVDCGEPHPIIRNDADLSPRTAIPAAVFETRGKDALDRRVFLYRQHYLQDIWNSVVESCDAFLFIWETFCPGATDLEVLKGMGKKVGVVFAGSEVRYRHVYRAQCHHYGMPYVEYGLKSTIEQLRGKLQYLRTAERHADFVSGFTGETGLSLRPVVVYAGMLDYSMIVDRPAQRKCPLIVHAPSRRATKGTYEWLAVLERLRFQGVEFEFVLLENVPHAKALQHYSEADIYLGSLAISGKGTREALAAGCVVLENFDRAFHKRMYEGCHSGVAAVEEMPVVCVDADTAGETLRELIGDVRRRQSIAEQGRVWVERHYDCAKNCEVFVKAFHGQCPEENIRACPFFRNEYVPEPDPGKLKVLNSYTKRVSTCDWYRKHVPAGTRAGLTF